MARAWLLNFDADEELARPEGPRKLPVSRALSLRLVRARVLLVPRGDLLVGEGPATAVHCWMPTRRALARIAQLGLPVPSAPSFDILRRVNSRRFSAALGAGPPGTAWLRDPAKLRIDGPTLLRTAHGFAGRGRHFTDALDDATLRFAEAAIARDGGFECAPRVRISAEMALHGFVSNAAITLGVPTVSHVDAQGQWQRVSVVKDELTTSERAALEARGHGVAEALRDAGYFGPFGIDAFRYDGGFCALSEINARYTMAWGRGMAQSRIDLC